MLGRQAKSVPGSLGLVRFFAGVFLVAALVGFCGNRPAKSQMMDPEKMKADYAKGKAEMAGKGWVNVEIAMKAASAACEDSSGKANGKFADVEDELKALDFGLWYECNTLLQDGLTPEMTALDLWVLAYDRRDLANGAMYAGNAKYAAANYAGAKADYEAAEQHYLHAQGNGNLTIDQYDIARSKYDQVIFNLRFW
jgi:hypothetical protein